MLLNPSPLNLIRPDAATVSSTIAQTLLPVGLPVEELTSQQIRCLLYFIRYSLKRVKAKTPLYGFWFEVPRDYWAKCFGGNYKRLVLRPLEKLGIVEVYKRNGRECFWNGKVSKKYRLSWTYRKELFAGRVQPLGERLKPVSLARLARQIAKGSDRSSYDLNDVQCAVTKANLAQLEPINPVRLARDLEEINRQIRDERREINVELTLRKALMLNYKQYNVTRVNVPVVFIQP
jgi:hypothetical protein